MERSRKSGWLNRSARTALCMGIALALPWVAGLSGAEPLSKRAARKPSAGPAPSAEFRTGDKRKASPAATAGPADYRSKNFLVHTDLSPQDADDLLRRLETMISLVSKYYGKPPVGVIECYVVQDLKKWPPGVLSGPGLAKIEEGAGVTSSQVLSDGQNFVGKSIVYAVADRGTPQHEAVHAYCVHAFGRAGPIWYAEGMAEIGQYWREGDLSVNAHPGVIEYLKSSRPKSLNQIVNGEEWTGDSWQNYAWRWALCHMLAFNPNYSPRFRPLGLALLSKDAPDTNFELVYGSMAQEITFEYMQFLEHIETGYRVDLCSWDWKAKFKKLLTSAVLTSLVDAGHGWQASKLTVVSGEEYEYSTTGTWSTGKGQAPVDASGDDQGVGRLVGVVMTDLQLGEPFDLGTFGSFVAPSDGDLYLRCQDKWSSLADNKGKITVRLKVKGKGSPLADPRAKEPPLDRKSKEALNTQAKSPPASRAEK